MKVLWAVEPFHQKKSQFAGMYKLLSCVADPKSEIDAVFVVTETENELRMAFDVPNKERFTSYPRKMLKKALKGAGADLPDRRVHIVNHPSFSNTATVERMLKLADDQGSELIALFTKSHTGFKRLLMGSFAETTIHSSRVNLLLATPKTKFPTSIRRVLYASDFSDQSKRHLPKLIEIAKTNGSTLIVFHAGVYFYGPEFKDHPEAEAYRHKLEEHRAWIEKQCRSAGVDYEIRITWDFAMVSDLVLKSAKKNKADLIAVAAKTGKVMSLMGGSITRQIVRTSDWPVLVLK